MRETKTVKATFVNIGRGTPMLNTKDECAYCDAVAELLRDHLDNAAGDSTWVKEALEILEGKK